MGTSCGLFSKQSALGKISLPRKDRTSKTMIHSLNNTMNKSVETFRKWNSIIKDVPHSPKTQKIFLRKILEGPPSEIRWHCWLSLFEISVDPAQYLSVPMAEKAVMNEIDRDITRTCPEDPYINSSVGTEALRRVLGKIAYTYKDVGYCQGMNCILAFLLIVSDGAEADCFFFYKEICKRFSLNQNFAVGMKGLKKLMWIFRRTFKKRIPKLYQHFKAEQFSEDYWLVKWLMTLFTMGFPSQVAMRIWDNFLIAGKKFFIHFSIALLVKFQDKLIHLDISGLCDFFNRFSNSPTDAEELIKLSNKPRTNFRKSKKSENTENTGNKYLGARTAKTSRNVTRFPRIHKYTTNETLLEIKRHSAALTSKNIGKPKRINFDRPLVKVLPY